MPRGISLDIYPLIHIVDTFVKTKVGLPPRQNSTISYDVWLQNGSAVARNIVLSAYLTSWNGHDWKYPNLPDMNVTLPAYSTVKVSSPPIRWTLGPKSFWWPNIPFREDHVAELHNIHFTIKDAGNALDTQTQRFGFVQFTEGANKYQVNGIDVFQFMDSTQEGMFTPDTKDGFGNAYAVTQGWLGGENGAKETWKKYLRLGINTFRVHSSAPTKAMLDAADEVGMMIVPESAIRGFSSPEEVWDPVYKPASVRAMIVTTRKHPSVARYSLGNEWFDFTRNDDISRQLIDAAVAEDDTRPLSYSGFRGADGVGRRYGTDGVHHAIIFAHYFELAPSDNEIRGVEETAWRPDDSYDVTKHNELIEIARNAITYRNNGYEVFGPWNINNYWPNFVSGASYDNKTYAGGSRNDVRPADRVDGVDGWGSPIVRFVQKAYHIFAAADLDLVRKTLGTERSIIRDGKVPALTPDSIATRKLVVFNNDLAKHTVRVLWELRWDSPTGEVVKSGITPGIHLNPAERAVTQIQFKVPKITSESRKLYFVLQTKVGGRVRFREDNYYF